MRNVKTSSITSRWKWTFLVVLGRELLFNLVGSASHPTRMGTIKVWHNFFPQSLLQEKLVLDCIVAGRFGYWKYDSALRANLVVLQSASD
jgi:hypothetical protein